MRGRRARRVKGASAIWRSRRALESIATPGTSSSSPRGVEWEIGGTGSKAVAERTSTYTPTIKFGKGFGDLPEACKYLRPLAVTGTVGYAIPGGGDEPRSIEWGGAIEYSLLYLQNNVRDQGFGNLVAHLTPVVEFSLSSPTGRAAARRARSTPASSGPGNMCSSPPRPSFR